MIASADLAVLYDVLSDGPVPAVRDLETWWTTRREFWRGYQGEVLGAERQQPFAPGLLGYRLLLGLDRLARADEIVIWLGTGLANQLTLAWLPHLLQLAGNDLATLRVVQFDRTPTGKPLQEIWLAGADALRDHPPARALTAEERNSIDQAWSAVTAADPSALVEFAGRSAGPLPLLGAAASRLLRRYPDRRWGLNIHEARLLTGIRERGPNASAVIAAAMTADFRDDGEGIGDNMLFCACAGSPTLPCPTPPSPSPASGRRCVEPTPA